MSDINARLDRIESILASIDMRLTGRAGAAPAPAGGNVAPDSELDSQYGNPAVRFVPRNWQGEDYKGRNYSECAPEFLDMLAETLEFFGRKNDAAGTLDNKGRPKGDWDRKDAARARGWAARLRARGGRPASPPARAAAPAYAPAQPRQAALADQLAGDGYGTDDIPF